jgi:hypothetical protein
MPTPPHPRLLDHRTNQFSQNGEDGILEFIFQSIGQGERQSCEFGAWDGIHFSNCRKLILEGWSCIMIEGEESRHRQLCQTYADTPRVVPVHCFVDTAGNSVDRIMERSGFNGLDLLSIDIDGLDYDIMASLTVRPRVICVEVNAGHSPEATELLPTTIARANIGQPLGAFARLATQMGYGLAGYNGNAFFVRNDCMAAAGWSPMTAEQAYDAFLAAATTDEREWLYLVNLGKVAPFHAYSNHRLDAAALSISATRAGVLVAKSAAYRTVRSAKRALS